MAMEELTLVLLLMMTCLFQDAEDSYRVQSGNDKSGAEGPVQPLGEQWPPSIRFYVLSYTVIYLYKM